VSPLKVVHPGLDEGPSVRRALVTGVLVSVAVGGLSLLWIVVPGSEPDVGFWLSVACGCAVGICLLWLWAKRQPLAWRGKQPYGQALGATAVMLTPVMLANWLRTQNMIGAASPTPQQAALQLGSVGIWSPTFLSVALALPVLFPFALVTNARADRPRASLRARLGGKAALGGVIASAIYAVLAHLSSVRAPVSAGTWSLLIAPIVVGWLWGLAWDDVLEIWDVFNPFANTVALCAGVIAFTFLLHTAVGPWWPLVEGARGGPEPSALTRSAIVFQANPAWLLGAALLSTIAVAYYWNRYDTMTSGD
jgi:hypothetical protein